MKLWRVSHRYRIRELLIIAILFLSAAGFIQLFSLPDHRITTKTEPYKLTEDRLVVPDKTVWLRKKVHEEQVLRFEPIADIILPTSHPVKLSGLQRLPDKFLTKLKKRHELMDYHLRPGRIVGENGLLATREFQGSSWSGAMMKGAVVFFVQSATGHLRRRMLVRETWASIRDIEGWKIEAVFVVGRSDAIDIQKQLSLENRVHGDILQYDGAERTRDSTVKVLAGIQWATSHLPGDFYYAFVSDDTLVDVAAIRDFLSALNLPGPPPGRRQIHVSSGTDGSTVISCQQQKIYCLETYREQEATERNLDLARSVDTDDYDAQVWPPYCSEGLYILPVSFAKELYEESRQTNLSLPQELHDVFITGILRRKINRGDDNIHLATARLARSVPILRLEILPRSSENKLAHYELDAEAKFRSTWTEWYEMVRFRFHIFTNLKYGT